MAAWRRRLWFALFVVIAAVHFYPTVRDLALRAEDTAAERRGYKAGQGWRPAVLFFGLGPSGSLTQQVKLHHPDIATAS